MATEVSFNSLIPIIISLAISVSWLLNRSILIAYEKDLLKESAEWLSKRPILIPTLTVFVLPTITAYLTLNRVPEILRFALPLLTFIAGQFFSNYERQNEARKRQIENLQMLKRKLSIARQKVYSNKTKLQIELDSFNSEGEGFIDVGLQFIDKITEEFSRLDTFSTLINEGLMTMPDLYDIWRMAILIDEFNEFIEDRRDYRTRLIGLTDNSANQYSRLLEQTDKELLKIVESFEQLMDKVSEIQINL